MSSVSELQFCIAGIANLHATKEYTANSKLSILSEDTFMIWKMATRWQ